GCADIRARVEAFFEQYSPSSKGLALFAWNGALQPIELPFVVENQASFGSAQIAPLLWVLDEYEPYLIVLVDQEKARFFLAQLGRVGFREGMEVDLEGYDFVERTTAANPTPGQAGGGAVHGGSGRDDHEAMLDEHRARMYRQVATGIETYINQRQIRRFMLGGSEQAAHAVKNLLPQKLQDTMVTLLNTPLRANLQDIFDQAQPKAIEHERQEEMQIVQEVIDFAKAGGRGALGHQQVQEALTMQRVELLILPWSEVDAEGVRPDLPLRAFASGGSVELVHGAAADLLKQEGGIAARLYYAL
ncbi:MAG: hypothetical protein J0M07_21880, partial [Anaerolineae bacterium]|nr:hypothetical protein [Anaerolineae bacterium]